MGNREAKELICMTHGYERSWGGGKSGWEGVCRTEGNKGGEWDNCNSIINKIYLKKKLGLFRNWIFLKRR